MPIKDHQLISLLVKSLLWNFFQWIILQWLRVERLWIRFTRTLLTIWGLVYRLNELVKNETGQPVETTDVDPQERNIVCRPPIQETQEPGIHPSNVFSDAIRKLRETLLDQTINEQRAITRDQPNQDQSQQGGDYCEEQGEQGVRDETPKEAEGEDSIQVLGHDVEVIQGKEVNQEGDKKNASAPEEEEPQGAEAALGIAKYVRQKAKETASKPPKAETTIQEESNVPGDVDRSFNQPAPVQPEASAEVQNSSSEEGPSATGNTANKRRKKRRKRKTAAERRSFNEGSSCDEVAVSRDPQTSTDESHHGSIEAFSSGNEEPAGSRDQETCKGK